MTHGEADVGNRLASYDRSICQSEPIIIQLRYILRPSLRGHGTSGSGMEHISMHRPIVMSDRSQYLGKRLVVSITYEDHDGELIRREQFHGLIVEAGESEIMIERADTGARQSLPPLLMPAR